MNHATRLVLSNMKNLISVFLNTVILSNIHTNGNPLEGPPDNVKPALENEFPFLISLGLAPASHDSDHFCGGTLISKRHILTAAHCFVNHTTGRRHQNPENIVVTIGSNNMTDGRKIGIDFWTTYDEWVHFPFVMEMSHDLAVATLLEEVTDIVPAFISRCKHRHLRGKKAVTAGWGLMNDGFQPILLQKTTLHLISRKKCRSNFIQTSEPKFSVVNHLCTTSKPMVVLGCGDSGGPLLINGNELIGINEGVCANDITDPNEQNSHTETYKVHQSISNQLWRMNFHSSYLWLKHRLTKLVITFAEVS